MLPIGWLVLAVVLAVILSMWVTFTITRLDRLHARVDAAQAALDAQLVRRAAALLRVAEAGSGPAADQRIRFERIAQDALARDRGDERQAEENAVGRAVADLAGGPHVLRPDAAEELREAAARVQVARRFYNDAVRDTRTLRARRLPRVLHLAGRAPLPQFFDIDDSLPDDPARPAPLARETAPDAS